MKGYCRIKTTSTFRQWIKTFDASKNKNFVGKDFDGIKILKEFSLLSDEIFLDQELLSVYLKLLKAIAPYIAELKRQQAEAELNS